MTRRLAAILAADVVGYSAMVEADEADALGRVRCLRDAVLEPAFAAHGGRAVKYMGDGVLADFGSVVDALACALAIQARLADTSAEGPDVKLRIGINLGDVVVEDGDLLGDGVNIAARLETLAEPGTVVVSATVREHAAGRVDAAFRDLGEVALKNIARPIRAYRATAGAEAGDQVSPVPASARPSIAVLPFANLSGDPEQGYFSDGITEDITVALARFRSLVVTAPRSSFHFRDPDVALGAVARELGVRYLVQGSVRQAGNRVRVTAQLTDTEHGHRVWAERYDRDLADVFAVQDEVTQSIVATLVSRVAGADIEQARTKTPENLKAYDYLLRGMAIIAHTAEDNRRAREMYERAAELDPGYARAYLGLSTCHMLDWTGSWTDTPEQSAAASFQCARKALELDPTDARVQARMGRAYLDRRQFDLAQMHIERGLGLNPCDTDIIMQRARLKLLLGEPDAAIAGVGEAMRLDPFHPGWYHWVLGQAHCMAGRFDDAIATLQAALARDPRFITPHRHMAVALVLAGRTEEARRHVAEILAIDPRYTLARVAPREPYRDEVYLESYLDALRKAGMPE